MSPEHLKVIETRLASLVKKPHGPTYKLTAWLRFVEHHYCEKLVNSIEIDRRLKLWCWLRALKSIKDPWIKYPYGYYEALKFAVIRMQIIFPRLMRRGYLSKVLVTWTPSVGSACKLKVTRVKPWSAVESKVEIQKLQKAANYLQEIKKMERTEILHCTRASGTVVRQHQHHKQKYQGKVFVCSSSKGAGLAEHSPFLKTILKERIKKIVVPDKGRLGRSGWRGSLSVLREAGIECEFEQGGERFNNQGDKIFRLVSGINMAGIVVLPSWLGIGEKLGKVAVISAEAGRNVMRSVAISSGSDWRVEQILLKLSLRGIRKPVKLLAPVDGKVANLCYTAFLSCKATQ